MLTQRGILFSTLGALALVSAACRDKSNDAVVTTTSATVEKDEPSAGAPVDPIAGAANHDSVMQYGDERKMTPTAATVLRGVVTPVREAPRGASLGLIAAGTDVSEVARKGDYFLVVYPDPKDATQRLAGWVYEDALTSASWLSSDDGAKKTATASCMSGSVLMRTDQDFCATPCKSDADCRSTGICDGAGFVLSSTNERPAIGRYCVGLDATSSVSSMPLEVP